MSRFNTVDELARRLRKSDFNTVNKAVPIFKNTGLSPSEFLKLKDEIITKHGWTRPEYTAAWWNDLLMRD